MSARWNVELSNKYSLGSGFNLSRLGDSAAASPLTSSARGYNLYTTLNYHY